MAICLTGAVQIFLSIYKVGRFAMYFPMSVLHGMLAAIGMLIIVKQIPSFLGHLTPSIKSIPEAIILIPAQIMGMNLESLRRRRYYIGPPLRARQQHGQEPQVGEEHSWTAFGRCLGRDSRLDVALSRRLSDSCP